MASLLCAVNLGSDNWIYGECLYFFAGDLWTDRRGIVCRAGGLYAGCEDAAAGGPTGWRLHRTSAVVTTAAAAIAAAAIAAVAMKLSVIVVLFVLAFTFLCRDKSQFCIADALRGNLPNVYTILLFQKIYI